MDGKQHESAKFRRIMDAIMAGDIEKLEAISREVPGFPDGEDGYIGRYWIIHAIDVGTIATVRWMLAKGVNLVFRDDEWMTPLHVAIDRSLADKHEIISLLLAAGADVNAQGLFHWTPAHMAAARDDVETLKLLVKYGADLAIRIGPENTTPLDEAREIRSRNAVTFLEKITVEPKGT